MVNLFLAPETYDLSLTSAKNLRLTADMGEFLSQKIETVLKTFSGEWFLNPDLGIPYFDKILIKQADLDDINSIFKSAVQNIEEVDEVLSFETDFNAGTRTYEVTFKVRAVSGETSQGTSEVTV